jgi:hypothetical protein
MTPHFTKAGSFEGDTIAARLTSGEFTLVALQRYFIDSQPDGSAVVHCETNDDDDDGVPDGSWENWDMEFPTVKKALKHCGKCRIGISGVIVTVTLDGEEVR